MLFRSTMGFDKNGNVISHTVLPNGQGVVWKNESTGQLLTNAPEGYHQGKNQQEMLANSSYAQSRNADETTNRKAVAAGLAPTFTEDQIEERASNRRNSILGLPTTTYGNTGAATGGGTPPTIPGQETTPPAATTSTAAPAGGSVVSVTYIKDWSLLNAADRIQYYYDPATGELGKDLAQLMTGIEYPGVQVQGVPFNATTSNITSNVVYF